ncbi:MAG: protein kinase, partial [Planctomycetes bacterium]|nr:protein kinase [Planctomycetota bacterium]
VFREASALAMIDHPNVISCFGFGEDKGRMYMALEILKGKDSNDLIVDNGGQPFSNEKLFNVSKQAIAGFQMVYKAGFIHRDIKPANIFVNDDGIVKVADLGLAWKGADISVEGAKGGLGTPSYMSPEQVLDEVEIDVRSDIYSMGASIYFYATGRSPFTGSDPMDIMRQVLSDQPDSIHSINSEVPEGVLLVVNKAMQKDRDLRYPSWKEFYEDVDAVSQGRAPQHAEVVNELQQAIADHGAFSAESSGSGGKIIGIIIVLILAAAGAFFALQGPSDNTDPEDNESQLVNNPDPIIADVHLSQLGNADIIDSAEALDDGYVLDAGSVVFRETKPLLNAIIENNVFSVELIITPEKDSGRDLARIVTFSRAYSSRNFTIAQKGGSFEIRVRTSNSQSGLRPRFVIDDVVNVGQRQHLMFVRTAKQHLLYIDGKEVFAVDVFGSLDNWDNSYPLILGNDIKGSSPWSGIIHGAIFFPSEFNAQKVSQRFKAFGEK